MKYRHGWRDFIFPVVVVAAVAAIVLPLLLVVVHHNDFELRKRVSWEQHCLARGWHVEKISTHNGAVRLCLAPGEKTPDSYS